MSSTCNSKIQYLYSDTHEKILSRSVLKNLNLITPVYDGLSLVNLAASLMSKIGAKTSTPKLDASAGGDYIENSEKVLFLLLDSLRFDKMLEFLNSELRASQLSCARDAALFSITSVAPATTATALVSISTCLPPASHGIVGYRMYLRDVGSLVKTLDFRPALAMPSASLTDVGIETLSYAKPVFANGNEPPVYLTYKRLVDTPFTKMITEGAKVEGYLSLADMMLKCVKALEESSLVLAYWGSLDTIAHEYGPESDEYLWELKHILHSLFNTLIPKLPKNTLVVITADHGHTQIEQAVEINKGDEIAKTLLIPPWGDSRFSYVKPFSEDAFKKIYEEKLKDYFYLFNSKELASLGLFGEVTQEDFYSRIGDYLLIAKEKTCLVYLLTKEDEEKPLKGRHGGLSPEEEIIPLLLIEL